MIKSVNPELVLIIPEEVNETMNAGLVKSEEQLKNERNQITRGTVKVVGEKVQEELDWPKEGDFVSFYRGAINAIEDEGSVYYLVNGNHILASIENK